MATLRISELVSVSSSSFRSVSKELFIYDVVSDKLSKHDQARRGPTDNVLDW